MNARLIGNLLHPHNPFVWILGLIAALLLWAVRVDDARCARILTHAQTPRDTLDASIACEAIVRSGASVIVTTPVRSRP